MNKYIVFTLSLLLLGSIIQAQPGDRVKQIRIGYLTEKIPLSTEDAQVFWPVYNDYSREMEALRAEGKSRLMDARQNIESMTDAELTGLADAYLGHKRKELAIMEKYHPKFKEILPPRKLIRFYRAEEEFPVWLLRQFKENRMGAPAPGGNFRPRNR